MTVRRLAEIQPASFAFTAENEAWAQKEIAKFPPGRQASAILPLLWRAQEQNGYWLSKAAIEKVAMLLDMPLMRALEVATFYSMFNLSPVGRHHVQLCGTTPCMLRGSDDLKKVCEQKIGGQNHVTADGALSWVEVECLGACCNAPMVQINNDYYEDLDPQNFTKLLDDLVAGRPVVKGSQTGRVSSEPVGGLTSLTSLYGVDGRGAPAAPQAAAPATAPPAPAAPEPTLQAAPAAVAPGADATPADIEAHAAAEEADIKAKLATLPKDATPEMKADSVGSRPKGLSAARADKADDLQRIKGIGPVNERKLHDLGTFHFDQIAAWARPEIRWVGTYLSFPGRIDREQWVAQAVSLAAGGPGLKSHDAAPGAATKTGASDAAG
jgi:NADH-quinone oxidoreductase subunit E